MGKLKENEEELGNSWHLFKEKLKMAMKFSLEEETFMWKLGSLVGICCVYEGNWMES